jgi:hypothetical protein
MATTSTSGQRAAYKQVYLKLRRNIGYLAMLLPFLVSIVSGFITPGAGAEGSISHYYHTRMGSVFVGILFVIGFFLLNYDPRAFDKSYGRKDRVLAIAAGTFAILAAYFPTAREGWTTLDPTPYPEELFGKIHLGAASLLFLTLIYFSGWLFTETKSGEPPRPRSKKYERNILYRATAIVMSLCIAGIAVYFLVSDPNVEPVGFFKKYPPVFILETMAIFAFGFAWAVKGDAYESLERTGKQVVKQVAEAKEVVANLVSSKKT